jgi:hypothetical protein
MQPLSFGPICPEMCRNYFSKQQFPPIPQFETVWRYSFTTVIHEPHIRLNQHSWPSGGACSGRRIYGFPNLNGYFRISVERMATSSLSITVRLVQVMSDLQ